MTGIATDGEKAKTQPTIFTIGGAPPSFALACSGSVSRTEAGAQLITFVGLDEVFDVAADFGIGAHPSMAAAESGNYCTVPSRLVENYSPGDNSDSDRLRCSTSSTRSSAATNELMSRNSSTTSDADPAVSELCEMQASIHLTVP